MKFISTIEKKDKPFVFEAPLDTSLFRKLTRDGDILSTDFDVATTVPSLPYFQGTDMSLFIEVSDENIYISAILFVGYDNCDKHFRPYEVDGMVSFNVELTEDEKRRLLLLFLKKYFMK